MPTFLPWMLFVPRYIFHVSYVIHASTNIVPSFPITNEKYVDQSSHGTLCRIKNPTWKIEQIQGISYLFYLLYSYFNERERCNCWTNIRSFAALKKRKRTVVTGDMKPMSDTLNQVLQDEIKPLQSETAISQKTIKKVNFWRHWIS